MSADGKTWNEIGEYDTNIVSVEGLEIQAQYLRYTATDEFVDEFTGSPNRMINIKEFAINQLSEQPDTSKNLALHKPVTVSTEKPDTTPAAAMTDGDMSTRWGASTGDYNHVEYAIVDLGEVHDIARFTSYFYGETTRAYLYKIYTSIDGQSYELCVDRSNNTTRRKGGTMKRPKGRRRAMSRSKSASRTRRSTMLPSMSLRCMRRRIRRSTWL